MGYYHQAGNWENIWTWCWLTNGCWDTLFSDKPLNDLVEFDGFWKLGYLIFEDLELELLNEFHWSRLEQWSVPPPFYPFTLFTLLHALWHIYYILWHTYYILHCYDIMYCIFLKLEWKVGSSGSPNIRAVNELACSRSLGLDGAIAWCCWWWSKFTARHCPQTLGIRMVHSNSWLMDDYSPKYGNPENESSQGSLLLSNKNSQIQNPFHDGIGWGLWLHSARQAMLATKRCTEHDELVVHSPTSQSCHRRHRNWDSPPAVSIQIPWYESWSCQTGLESRS